MKKILTYLFILICLFSYSFAYTPTNYDTNLLNSFYKTVDKIFIINKEKVLNLNKNISILKQGLIKDDRTYYILSEIENHINWLTVQKDNEEINETNESNKYPCWIKRYCYEMNSCEEVKYYFYNCWLNRLDGDWDWIPCEELCE